MRKVSKFISCLVAAVSAFSVAACTGPNNDSGSATTLKIAIFEGGYGDTWGKALADAYKKYNPSVDVEVDCNALVRDDAQTAASTNSTNVDLFFVDGIGVGNSLENYGSLADLTELYASKPKAGDKEEELTVAQKIRPEIVSEMMYGGDRAEFKGKYYTAPSASGPCSIIINEDAMNNVFGAGNWSEPRTTDELIALCDAIVEKNAKVKVAGVNYTVYPFIYAGNALEYWRYMYYPWIAQYDGVENWDDFVTVTKDGEYSMDAYQPEGKAKAYSVFEKIVKRANGYCDTTSMNNKFAASQKYFFQGRACMYVTGDWLEKDSERSDYSPNLKMIRTPVISDLAEKLESEYSINLGATAAAKDSALSELIKAVDEGKTSVDGYSDELVAKITETRAITYTLANSAIAFVPACSKKKDLAIDFLRFMYTDEGATIILNDTKAYLPLVNSSDIKPGSDLSSFRLSINAISGGNVKYIYTSSRNPIRYRAGLDYYIGNEKPEVSLGKRTGALTAAELLEKEKRLLSQTWSDYMRSVKK